MTKTNYHTPVLLKESIDKKEEICILGDYDVDGSVATSLFVKFLKNLKVVKPGMSLAGVETTVNFPMKTSHGLLTQDERDNQGIGNKLIRLSVGIESYKDLFNDLDQAIKNSLI